MNEQLCSITRTDEQVTCTYTPSIDDPYSPRWSVYERPIEFPRTFGTPVHTPVDPPLGFTQLQEHINEVLRTLEVELPRTLQEPPAPTQGYVLC